MADLLAAKRARMACRAYLKLHDAGPAGAPLTKDDLLGPRDDPAADFAVAVELLGRFVDDTILDEPGHRDGVPHYALTAGMRDRMAARQDDGATLAETIRAGLAAADRGAAEPDGAFSRCEILVRTGRPEGEPV